VAIRPKVSVLTRGQRHSQKLWIAVSCCLGNSSVVHGFDHAKSSRNSYGLYCDATAHCLFPVTGAHTTAAMNIEVRIKKENLGGKI
jgi:hypothetical protein